MLRPTGARNHARQENQVQEQKPKKRRRLDDKNHKVNNKKRLKVNQNKTNQVQQQDYNTMNKNSSIESIMQAHKMFFKTNLP